MPPGSQLPKFAFETLQPLRTLEPPDYGMSPCLTCEVWCIEQKCIRQIHMTSFMFFHIYSAYPTYPLHFHALLYDIS